MQANRFHLGKVIEELEQNIIDSALMEEAKIKSKGLDQVVFAYYLVSVSYTHLRAHET